MSAVPMHPDLENLLQLVREVADFPAPGIRFKDIAPLLAERRAITLAIDALYEPLRAAKIDAILAVDARGFVIGAPLADRLGVGFVMVRKAGKLPGEVDSFNYECEYSTGRLEITRGLIQSGAQCLIVDDVLATGGTVHAIAEAVKQLGGSISGFCFLVELTALNGRARLLDAPIFSLIRY